jgi:VanZ family protein
MPRLFLRLVFVLFTSGFVSLIVVADRGGAGHLWDFVGRIPCGDKLGHLVLVGTLSLLLNLMLEGRRGPGRRPRILPGSVLLLVVMTLEEGSQAFIPHRSFDPLDWLANVIGIFCGEGLLRMLPGTARESPARGG